MKLNYLILFHRDFEQLKSLLSKLHTDDSNFFIHIDKKFKLSPEQKHYLAHTSNLQVSRKRIDVLWGHYSIIEATMLLLKLVISHSPNPDKDSPVILLSGQDLPIKSNGQIFEYFKNARGHLFLDHSPFPNPNWDNGGLIRLERFCITKKAAAKYDQEALVGLQKKHRRLYRLLTSKITFFGGSQWFSLNIEACRYIMDYVQENRNYTRYFKFTIIPDEMFFHTILMNSPFADRIINDNLKFIKWDAGRPKILTISDFDDMINSSKLFARKFDPDIDAKVMLRLNEVNLQMSDT